MKKLFMLLVTVILICILLSSCGDEGGTEEKGSDVAKIFNDSEDKNNSNTFSADGELRRLDSPDGECSCITENGYYYLTSEVVELKDGSYGSHLMYMPCISYCICLSPAWFWCRYSEYIPFCGIFGSCFNWRIFTVFCFFTGYGIRFDRVAYNGNIGMEKKSGADSIFCIAVSGRSYSVKAAWF